MQAEAPAVRLGRIGQIALRVNDVARAETFYKNVLGMTHLFSAPPALAFFDCGGVRLMLSEGEAPAAATSGSGGDPSSVLYYPVQDLRAVHATLAGRGVAFVSEPHVVHRAETYELWMAFFGDGEGNTLALMEEAPL